MPRKSSAANTTIALPAPVGSGRNQKRRVWATVVDVLTTVIRWGFWISLLVGTVWGVGTLEQFVISDKRFVLAGPPDPGIPSEFFQIVGAAHASEQQITDTFTRDFGRSIYLCPIAERRRRLLAIDWVKDATVTRIWPNRIVVRIRERVPVAFVQLPGPDNAMIYGLIDEDGVMLDPRRASKLALPVLTGIRPKEADASRRDKVKRFVRLQTEIGPELMDKISEIDLSEPDNVRVVQVVEGRAVTLLLGNQQFLPRFQSFQDNYPEIQKRLGRATVLDLRLKDRFTAVATEESSQ